MEMKAILETAISAGKFVAVDRNTLSGVALKEYDVVSAALDRVAITGTSAILILKSPATIRSYSKHVGQVVMADSDSEQNEENEN
jgi:hypothetical protein